MINFGEVPAGAVLPVMFDSFAGSTGASITITGLAVTDIEIYKGTSMTQRASDAGYALLDTDGIDIDGTTGIHGFSIDTGDNTDAGFYAAGSFYNVVVSAITVDSQTVNFIAATFRIKAAENTAGVPIVDVVRYAGSTTNVSTMPTNVADVLVDTAEIGTAGAGLTNINLPNQTMDIVGNITGNLSGSVGSVTAAVSITSNIKQNQALANIPFLMIDDVHAQGFPLPGLTVTIERKIDGGAFGAGGLSAVTETGNGWYRVDAAQADMNGKAISFRATATGASDCNFTIYTTP